MRGRSRLARSELEDRFVDKKKKQNPKNEKRKITEKQTKNTALHDMQCRASQVHVNALNVYESRHSFA